MLKVFEQLNPIRGMNLFTKTSYIFCMEEWVKLLKTYVTKTSN